jgi:hypothetical protein
MRTYVTHERFLRALEEGLRRAGADFRLAAVALEPVGRSMLRMSVLARNIAPPVGRAVLRLGDDGRYTGVLEVSGRRIPLRMDGSSLAEVVR